MVAIAMLHGVFLAGDLLGALSAEGRTDPAGPLLNWTILFLVTLAIELPMVMIAWRVRRCESPLRPWLLASLVGNLISHPTATFLATFMAVPAGDFLGMIYYMLLETGSIAIEAWAFRLRAATTWTEAAVMALAANAITAILGAYLLFAT